MSRNNSIENLVYLMQRMYKLSYEEAYDIVREMIWTISDTRDWMFKRGASAKEVKKAMRSIFQDYTGIESTGWVESLFD